VYLRPFRLADRPVTNASTSRFSTAGGYRDAAPWLSEGWRAVQERGWPGAAVLGARGRRLVDADAERLRALDPHAPVTHVSYYEADAYARWRGARLPTEQEWEHAAADAPVRGNFQDDGVFSSAPAPGPTAPDAQMFGDVWEWTQSAYAALPGYRRAGRGRASTTPSSWKLPRTGASAAACSHSCSVGRRAPRQRA